MEEKGKLFRAICIKGVKGSFTETIDLYEQCLYNAKLLCELMLKEKIPEQFNEHLFLVTFGFFSENQKTVRICFTLFAELVYEFFIHDSIGLIWIWFIKVFKGVSIITKIILDAKNGLLVKEGTKVLAQLSRFSFTELFCVEICNVLTNPDDYFLFLWKLLPKFYVFKGIRELIFNSGFIEWINERITFANHTKTRGSFQKDINFSQNLKIHHSLLLSFLLKEYQSELDQNHHLCNLMLDNIKTTLRSGDIITKIQLCSALFEMLNSFAQEKLSFTQNLYKLLVFLFFENYMDEEIRQLFLLNFINILKNVKNLPIKILVEVFSRQLLLNDEISLGEVNLIIALINHEKMNAENGLKLYKAMKKFYFNDLCWSRVLDKPLESLAQKYLKENKFMELIIDCLNIALSKFIKNQEEINKYLILRNETEKNKLESRNFPDSIFILKHNCSMMLNYVKDLLCIDDEKFNEQAIIQITKANYQIEKISGNESGELRKILMLVIEETKIQNIFEDFRVQQKKIEIELKSAKSKTKNGSIWSEHNISEKKSKFNFKKSQQNSKKNQNSEIRSQKSVIRVSDFIQNEIIVKEPEAFCPEKQCLSSEIDQLPSTCLQNREIENLIIERPDKIMNPEKNNIQSRGKSSNISIEPKQKRSISIRENNFRSENEFIFVKNNTDYSIQLIFNNMLKKYAKEFNDFFKILRIKQKVTSFKKTPLEMDLNTMNVTALISFIYEVCPEFNQNQKSKTNCINNFINKNLEKQNMSVHMISKTHVPAFLLNAMMIEENTIKSSPNLSNLIELKYEIFLKRCFDKIGLFVLKKQTKNDKLCSEILTDIIEDALNMRLKSRNNSNSWKVEESTSIHEFDVKNIHYQQNSLVNIMQKMEQKSMLKIPEVSTKNMLRMEADFKQKIVDLKKDNLRRERTREIEEKLKKMKDEKIKLLELADEEKERKLREKHEIEKMNEEKKQTYLKIQKEKIKKFREEQIKKLAEIDLHKQQVLRAQSANKKVEVMSFLKAQNEKLKNHLMEIKLTKEQKKAKMIENELKIKEKMIKNKLNFMEKLFQFKSEDSSQIKFVDRLNAVYQNGQVQDYVQSLHRPLYKLFEYYAKIGAKIQSEILNDVLEYKGYTKFLKDFGVNGFVKKEESKFCFLNLSTHETNKNCLSFSGFVKVLVFLSLCKKNVASAEDLEKENLFDFNKIVPGETCFLDFKNYVDSIGIVDEKIDPLDIINRVISK